MAWARPLCFWIIPALDRAVINYPLQFLTFLQQFPQINQRRVGA